VKQEIVMEGVSVGSESCFRSARLELQVGMLIVVAYFATQQVTGVVVEPEACGQSIRQAGNPRYESVLKCLGRVETSAGTASDFPFLGKSGGGRSKNYKKRNEA